MDARTFDKFREIVYEKSGITLGPNKEALVSARVAKRMRALRIPDHERYLEFLLQDSGGEEFVHLIDAISTNVTSFFREANHFDFLRDTVAAWAAKGKRRFRIWCAASSTGEEPYSIAMILLETLRGANVRILATDISTRVLDACREGTYSEERVQKVPAPLRKKYFYERRNGSGRTYEVKDLLKDIVVFKRLNLATPPFPMRGPLDIVFCRNVMIYFDNEVRRGLLGEIYRLLKPGGYLMVGHAESLTGMVSDFRSVCPSIYVRPA